MVKAAATDDSKDFVEKANAMSTANTALGDANATATTDAQGLCDTQAALEKAWMEAWLLNEYWKVVTTQLADNTVGGKHKKYKEAFDAIDSGSEAGVSKSTADSNQADAKENLEKAEATLAGLVATASAADAVVKDL